MKQEIIKFKSKYMNVQQALLKIEKEPLKITKDTKLSVIWEKVKPLIGVLSLVFGKKVKVYVTAFIAAIDSIVEQEGELKSKKRNK